MTARRCAMTMLIAALAVLGMPRATALTAGAWTAVGADATHARLVSAAPPLVEHERCGAPRTTDLDSVALSSAAAGEPGVSVSVAIGWMVWVKLDRAGEPIAAMTNSGCAPRFDHRFLLDGGAPLPGVHDAAVMACATTGDWRVTGEWVALSC